MVDKLTLESNKLELILKNQRESYDRDGIGYNTNFKNRISANKFFAFTSSQNLSIVYFCCKGIGHKVYICSLRKKNWNKIKNGSCECSHLLRPGIN